MVCAGEQLFQHDDQGSRLALGEFRSVITLCCGLVLIFYPFFFFKDKEQFKGSLKAVTFDRKSLRCL